MTDKAKLKGLRPLLPMSPLMTLSPVIGACNSNRIHRAEEAQTLLLLNPSTTESTSPAVVSVPQIVPAILPLALSMALSTDSTSAEPQSAGLPGALVGPLLAPPTGLTAATGLSSHIQAINLPDKGGQGVSELHRAFTELHRGLTQQHRASSEPLALPALTSETQQHPYEVAFQNGPDLLDLNRDAVITSQDAQVLYYLALFQANTINQATLTPLLNNLIVTDLSPDELTALMNLNLLNPNAAVAPIEALDLNLDGRIDLQDVRVLYYVYRFEDILRASASLREILLGDLTVGDDEDGVVPDDEYLAILDRAAALSLPVNVDEPPTAVTLSGTVTTLDENTSHPHPGGRYSGDR